MNNQINLPSLTLPAEIKGELSFASSVTNYKQYHATYAVIDALSEHVPADYLNKCSIFIQEIDNTLNDRIYTLSDATLRLRYIIDAAGATLRTHDINDNVTSEYTPANNTWVLQNASNKLSTTGIVGVQTSILLRYSLSTFTESSQTWIDSVII